MKIIPKNNANSDIKRNVNAHQCNAVRSILIDGDPWFVAKDVCDILDIKNPSDTLRDFPENERFALDITEAKTMGFLHATAGVNLINEPGVYRLIFQSRKPEAEAFKTWVFAEVLPAIRQTGSYGATTILERISDKKLSDLLKAYMHRAITAAQFQISIGLTPAEIQLDENPLKITQTKTFNEAVTRDGLRGFIEAYLNYYGFHENEITSGDALSRHKFTRWILQEYETVVFDKVARVNGKLARCFSGLKMRPLDEISS